LENKDPDDIPLKMKKPRKPRYKIKPPAQSETDLILSSPKLLRSIEVGVKEMREGKLLSREEFLKKSGRRIAHQLSSKNISEKKILDDFQKYKTKPRKTKATLQKAAHDKAYIKEFRRVRRKMQAKLKKLGLSYTEEQIFKMVS